MGLAPRAVGGTILTVVVVVAAGACGSYGEEGSPSANADASISVDAAREDATAILDSSPTTEAAVEAGFSELCPNCPGTLCLASGCSGAPSLANDCRTPYEGRSGDRFSVFVCPEGQTVTLPQQCNDGGTVHVAVVRLGAGEWHFRVTGTMPLVASGDCGTITACRGGSSTTDVNVTGPTTAMIGSFSPVASCRELTVELD
jgi:hypothetical protein